MTTEIDDTQPALSTCEWCGGQIVSSDPACGNCGEVSSSTPVIPVMPKPVFKSVRAVSPPIHDPASSRSHA